MKSSGELGRPGPGRAPVELVAGPLDGERWHHPIEPTTMMPPEKLTRQDKGRDVVYVRRVEPSRCVMDGIAVWHYDAQRPDVPA